MAVCDGRSMAKTTILMNLRVLPQPATLSERTRMVIKILTDLPSQPFLAATNFFILTFLNRAKPFSYILAKQISLLFVILIFAAFVCCKERNFRGSRNNIPLLHTEGKEDCLLYNNNYQRYVLYHHIAYFITELILLYKMLKFY